MQTFIWSFLQLEHWKISESLACLMQRLVFDTIKAVKVAFWFCSPTKRPLRVLRPLTIFWIGAHFVCHAWRGLASQLKFKLRPKLWIALSLWFVSGICFWIQLPAWKTPCRFPILLCLQHSSLMPKHCMILFTEMQSTMVRPTSARIWSWEWLESR